MKCCWVGLVLIMGATVAEMKPREVLDLSRWKLTLPRDDDGDGRADEVPSAILLNGFTEPGSFLVDETGEAVVFRARCGAPTTKGSSYPRSELRELDPRGKSASWATGDEMIHRLEMTARITRTPAVKRHVVCAQIHDAENDVLMVRLEGRKLMIERGGLPDLVLDAGYELGTSFDLKIEAGNGRVRVYYNGRQALDWEVERGGCYFKAGCYTQSNVERGDAADDFGEVRVTRLVVDGGAGR